MPKPTLSSCRDGVFRSIIWIDELIARSRLLQLRKWAKREKGGTIGGFPMSFQEKHCQPKSLFLIFYQVNHVYYCPGTIIYISPLFCAASRNNNSKFILQVIPFGPKGDSLWHKVHCLTKQHTLTLSARGDANPRWGKAIFYLYYLEFESSAHTLQG